MGEIRPDEPGQSQSHHMTFASRASDDRGVVLVCFVIRRYPLGLGCLEGLGLGRWSA
jgi:hypothetical protein